MRWDGQLVTAESSSALPGLAKLSNLVRSVQTPEFAGITFHEVLAKSALSRVPSQSSMPFGWTINPYRGCSHACSYCFARKTHSYLGLGTGLDFDSQLVVKINAGEVLRRELAKPSWKHEHVAMGTNTDPYQRAEGRYKLMPEIIKALADSGTPFSILTKGTLLARDLPLLGAAAKAVDVDMGISLAMTDAGLAHSVEAGTPTPRARLDLIAKLSDAGMPCSVMAMPILPWLTDSEEALDDLCASVAAAGATRMTAGALHLRPGAREWYMQWLAQEHPQLVGPYRRLYDGGTYAAKDYRSWLAIRVGAAKRRHGLENAARMREVKVRQPEEASKAGRREANIDGQATLF